MTNPLALVLFAGAAILGPASENSGPADAIAVSGESFGLQAYDEAFLGIGPGYKARLTEEGFEFTPALGDRAPRNFPLGFTLESIRRGEGAFHLAPPEGVAPAAEGTVVRYERGGGVTETIEVRAEGIEQSFLFETLPPGSGDLVVRGRVTTELPASSIGKEVDEIRFEVEGLGGVRVDSVIGIDAEGTRAPGWLRFDGTHLEIGLPGEFVDTAVFPLLLDPLVGPVIGGFGSASQNNNHPDVAYDATNGVYLVVWERVSSATDHDIFGQRVSSAGAFVGAFILIEGGTDYATKPSVGNVNQTDRFLVAYQKGAGSAGPFDVFARAVDAATGAVSAALTVAGNAGDDIDPDVGGNRVFSILGGGARAIVVWEWVGFGIQARVVSVPASPASPTNVTGGFAVSVGAGVANPSISKHGGAGGRCLVVWNLDPAVAGQNTIQGRVVDFTGALLTPVGGVSNQLGVTEIEPGTDTKDGTEFLVAWKRYPDIVARKMAFSGGSLVTASTAAALTPLALPTYHVYSAPQVGWTGELYAVTWELHTAGLLGGTADLVETTSLDPTTCIRCETIELTSDGVEPALATQWSGGSTGDGALIAWTEIGSPNQVAAQRYRSDVGQVTNLGGGCGTGGTASAVCATPGSNNFTHRLTGAIVPVPLAPVFLVIGLGESLNYPCGPCTLVPDPFTSFVFPATYSLLATVDLTLPSDPSLVGVTIVDQWVIPKPSGACGALGSDLSNAIEIVIGT